MMRRMPLFKEKDAVLTVAWIDFFRGNTSAVCNGRSEAVSVQPSAISQRRSGEVSKRASSRLEPHDAKP